MQASGKPACYTSAYILIKRADGLIRPEEVTSRRLWRQSGLKWKSFQPPKRTCSSRPSASPSSALRSNASPRFAGGSDFCCDGFLYWPLDQLAGSLVENNLTALEASESWHRSVMLPMNLLPVARDHVAYDVRDLRMRISFSQLGFWPESDI